MRKSTKYQETKKWVTFIEQLRYNLCKFKIAHSILFKFLELYYVKSCNISLIIYFIQNKKNKTCKYFSVRKTTVNSGIKYELNN
jgi:hypothetical protein